MKYLKIDPFEKHLNDSLPEHPSDLYFVVMADAFERGFVAEKISRKLGLDVIRCESDHLLKELESPSLFSKKRALICDEARDKEIPKEVDDFILIFTGKTPPPFFKKLEKRGTTLDLSREKPWDRTSRLQRWLLEYVRDLGKMLEMDGVAYLLDFAHADFAMLLQELDKVITYSGEAKQLTLEMVKKVCSLHPIQSGWQLSEAVVLGSLLQYGEMDLYALVGQLRYQLEFGLQISMEKEPLKASPKKVERFRRSGLKPSYFIEGLKDLFALEMKMRSNISNQELLFDQFRARLAARR